MKFLWEVFGVGGTEKEQTHLFVNPPLCAACTWVRQCIYLFRSQRRMGEEPLHRCLPYCLGTGSH